LIIDSDIEYQLRSGALKRRLLDASLSQGSIEFYLRYTNLNAIVWGKKQPFGGCISLLRVDLSGCPKLESIPKLTFGSCRHLASVVFGEHSNITNLGEAAFNECSALTSITLPDKLEIIEPGVLSKCSALERVVCNKNLKTIDEGAFQFCFALKSITLPDKLARIEQLAFNTCTSLERVVCNKNLKTIDQSAFQACSKLEDVQLASGSISFGDCPFAVCDRLIKFAAATGFPSNTVSGPITHVPGTNLGAGVVPYLIDRFERK